MLAALAELIPGAARWPRFRRNRSEQFEGRLSMVEIAADELALLRRHGGLAAADRRRARGGPRRVRERGRRRRPRARRWRCASSTTAGASPTRYPANPNGSPDGIAGLASSDGRVTILMPHPERVFRTVQNSWHPAAAGEDSGWMRMFRNARVWVG